MSVGREAPTRGRISASNAIQLVRVSTAVPAADHCSSITGSRISGWRWRGSPLRCSSSTATGIRSFSTDPRIGPGKFRPSSHSLPRASFPDPELTVTAFARVLHLAESDEPIAQDSTKLSPSSCQWTASLPFTSTSIRPSILRIPDTMRPPALARNEIPADSDQVKAVILANVSRAAWNCRSSIRPIGGVIGIQLTAVIFLEHAISFLLLHVENAVPISP